MRGTTSIPQVLIAREGLDTTAATWEDKADIMLTYPNFNLDDKVTVNRGSLACTPVIGLDPQTNESASEEINSVTNLEMTGARLSERIKIPN